MPQDRANHEAFGGWDHISTTTRCTILLPDLQLLTLHGLYTITASHLTSSACALYKYTDISPHLFCLHSTENLRTAQTQELQQQPPICRTSWCSLPRSESGRLLPSKSIHPLVNDRKAPSKTRDNGKFLDFIISRLLKTREQSWNRLKIKPSSDSRKWQEPTEPTSAW